MVRNSKRVKQNVNNITLPQGETLTQISLTTRNIFGNLSINAIGFGTADIFTVPSGYRLKIYTIQHGIACIGDDKPSTSYVYTNDLNTVSGGTNIISIAICSGDGDSISSKTYLKEFPYVCLPGEIVRLRIYLNGTTGTYARAGVIINGVLEPLNN